MNVTLRTPASILIFLQRIALQERLATELNAHYAQWERIKTPKGLQTVWIALSDFQLLQTDQILRRTAV